MSLQQGQQPSVPLGDNGKVLTVEQVAERLQVDPSKVYQWVRSGALPAYNLADPGKRAVWRVEEDELIEWLKARHNQLPDTEPPEET